VIRAFTMPTTKRVQLTMPWWQIGLYALANVPLIVVGIGGAAIDWTLFADAPAAFFRGDLYAPSDVRFVWSPIAALILAAFVPFGYVGWVALHIAVVALLANPTLILLVALSGGFWVDLAFGNTVTFVFVAGVLALRGNKLAGLASVALFVLMPRPIQVPLIAWLLWRNPSWRLPGLAIISAHLAAVLATGYGPDWIASMQAIGPQQMAPEINWGPTALIGYWWFIVGLPVGIWLAFRGYVGLAGLALSPYILPHYAIMTLLDWKSAMPDRVAAAPRAVARHGQ
jgi:hypothetical protein